MLASPISAVFPRSRELRKLRCISTVIYHRVLVFQKPVMQSGREIFEGSIFRENQTDAERIVYTHKRA
jgi:hypothetical protein